MGWDAYANTTRDGHDVWLPQPVNGVLAAVSPELESVQQAFVEADAKLRQITGEGGLISASIGCKCEFIRATAHTGFKCYDPNNRLGQIDWTPEQVQTVQERAEWDFEPSRDEDYGLAFFWYWQSRLFLETCAQHGLSIRFTW